MRVAILLNSRAIEGDTPITIQGWSDVYRDFLEASLTSYKAQNGGGHSETLEYVFYDVVGKQEYPEDISSLDAIILTGGTDSFVDEIPWVSQMMEFIRMVVKYHTVKLVGFCWGHQAIAHALDGEVIENPNGTEAGITEIVLSSTGRALFHVPKLQMHQIHRRVVKRMPTEFKSLGSSARTEIQGMILDDRVRTLAMTMPTIEGKHDGNMIGVWLIKFILGGENNATAGVRLKGNLIDPPIMNSSSPWASEASQILDLYRCDSTGAVVTRTSMPNGFPENKSVHMHAFQVTGNSTTSFNTYGFSPHLLSYYLETIMKIYSDETIVKSKPFIVSIGGSTEELGLCIEQIQARRDFLKHSPGREICVELNLSCPNIPDHPPPSYDSASLHQIISKVVVPATVKDSSLVMGLKITPFTYTQQFTDLCQVLTDPENVVQGQSPITYIAATNTLGGTLPLTEEGPLLPGSGLGGMAGHSIHALSLGTVSTLRKHLNAHKATQHIKIIGIGGVSDAEGAERMRQCGADAVGVATALGVQGIDVFAAIQGRQRERNALDGAV